jgi:intracellular septation protein
MKFLFDYFPIIVFFVIYILTKNIYIATAVTMGASLLQVGVYWLMHKRFEKFHVITMVFILLLGGFTLLFHNPIFIKWKPTIVYWVFSVVLLGSQILGKKSLIHRMLDEKIALPIKVWTRINLSWAIFFLLLGVVNLYVVYNYSTSVWVYFKFIGTLGLMIIFIFFQALYMSKHMHTLKKNDQSKN